MWAEHDGERGGARGAAFIADRIGELSRDGDAGGVRQWTEIAAAFKALTQRPNAPSARPRR